LGVLLEVVDPADPTTKLLKIRLAELTPVFLQFLQTSKTTAAVQMFQDEVEHSVKGLKASDNFLDSMSSSNSEVDSRCVEWMDGQSKCTRSMVNDAQTEQVEWTGMW
jgi:hypothetical protein